MAKSSLLMATHQEATRNWWDMARFNYDLFTSEFVMAECANDKYRQAAKPSPVCRVKHASSRKLRKAPRVYTLHLFNNASALLSNSSESALVDTSNIRCDKPCQREQGKRYFNFGNPPKASYTEHQAA